MGPFSGVPITGVHLRGMYYHGGQAEVYIHIDHACVSRCMLGGEVSGPPHPLTVEAEGMSPTSRCTGTLKHHIDRHPGNTGPHEHQDACSVGR